MKLLSRISLYFLSGILLCLVAAAVYAYSNRQYLAINPTLGEPPKRGEHILQYLTVADDHEISIFAALDAPARQIALADDGWIFVGTNAGIVYAMRDSDQDGTADDLFRIVEDSDHGHGVAYHQGDLYIGAPPAVYRLKNVRPLLQAQRTAPASALQPFISEGLINSSHHGSRDMEIGPDGKLYLSLGVPCDICIPPSESHTGVIRRYDIASGDNVGEIYARGIRNAVGMAFHPQDEALWFTDNGRDWLGDDAPHDELNRISTPGEHFGYPFCHQGDMPDPKYGDADSCAAYTPPAQLTGPHVANLGMTFNADGSRAYIALHGSWNRSKKIGYAVYQAVLEGEEVVEYAPFVTGWLRADENVFGRPVDVERLPDGSLLVTDDYAEVVYRISKQP